MIIKSMSRKAPTFAQLIGYINRGADLGDELDQPFEQGGAVFARNLYQSGEDFELVADQFAQNYRYLPHRKNGNALYHEVIVLEPQGHLSKARIEAALHDLAEEYCANRAPDQLAWGRVHWDTGHPHIHLMISANEVRSDLRVRLTKSEFAKVQRDLEAFKEARLPELHGRSVYRQNRHSRPKVKSHEGEMVRRKSVPSDKQNAALEIKTILKTAAGLDQVKTKLKASGFALYQRGQTYGVEQSSTGRKYRLKTLGLDANFHAALARPSANEIAKPEPGRISVSPNPPANRPKPPPKSDARADALKAQRDRLNARARDMLDGFDHEEENER